MLSELRILSVAAVALSVTETGVSAGLRLREVTVTPSFDLVCGDYPDVLGCPGREHYKHGGAMNLGVAIHDSIVNDKTFWILERRALANIESTRNTVWAIQDGIVGKQYLNPHLLCTFRNPTAIPSDGQTQTGTTMMTQCADCLIK
ncbi:hypothetical protein B0H14DRAFT_2605015 [Mycena olivaceomarginata]|nr:hypothetical protein B0H14DRAFT_2605015 [Mycena olivaceomarginata]